MYVDPVLSALFEGLGALFGGGALASAAACCGLPLGLLLLIIGLVSSNGPKAMPVQAYGQATTMPTTLGAMPRPRNPWCRFRHRSLPCNRHWPPLSPLQWSTCSPHRQPLSLRHGTSPVSKAEHVTQTRPTEPSDGIPS